MDADLDTLATALYVTTGDLLRITPERAPWRPAVGCDSLISVARPARTGEPDRAGSHFVKPLHQTIESIFDTDKSQLGLPPIKRSLLAYDH